MVNAKSVEDQLKKLHFSKGWNKPEADELAEILLADEEIFECVNGWYEGGFALLCSTNVRVLLIDKKPFHFLNIEDVRFDTINQIDFYHRMFNASICISAGLKELTFRSYNQARLRKLISHVQHRMAELKSMEQAERVKKLAGLDELEHQPQLDPVSHDEQSVQPLEVSVDQPKEAEILPNQLTLAKQSTDINMLTSGVATSDLYEDGIKEIFGRYQADASVDPTSPSHIQVDLSDNGRDNHALRIAYSKLPQILQARKNQVAAVV